MQNDKQKKVINGWIEVLFRKKTSPVSSIRGPKSIDFADYSMPGSRMPLTEFESAIDVYEFYSKPQDGVGRIIKEFDIVNLVYTAPQKWVKTLVLIDPYSEMSRRFHYEGSEKRSHWTPDRLPLCMQPLQRPLGSYCERQ